MERKDSTRIPGIPTKEKIWVTHKTEQGNTYYITANQRRDMYFIYQNVDGTAVKQGRGQNPALLLSKYAK